ncbi:MAG: phosphopyruvate hydratase [Candidatus Paceibacterota bacterium]
MFSNKYKIKSVHAREILDSRGNPTLEATVVTSVGTFVAGVPSGASAGIHEAVELRDNDQSRYGGKGVLKAAANVNSLINPALVGMDCRDQAKIDKAMRDIDQTPNKGRLGANAICGVSLAVCRAAAGGQNLPLYRYIAKIANTKEKEIKLPKAGFNIINGGAHAGGNLDVQELMISPQGDKFSDNLRAASEIYHQLRSVLAQKYGKSSVNIGDEGGFAPPVDTPKEALECLNQAIVAVQPPMPVKYILDVASSQFFNSGKYNMHIGSFGGAQLADFYTQLLSQFPQIIGLEDPFAEDDWVSWQNFKFSGMLIGDDLLVTNPFRIKEAHEKKACNAMILKINQISTVSEALEAAHLAKSYGWKVIVSHRSGETNDDFIADFAVGIAADFIKSGAPARGERLAKYNRLVKIEEELNE